MEARKNTQEYSNYSCIVIDERTNSGEPVSIKARNKEEAKEICSRMYPHMKIAAVVEIGKW